MREWQIIINGWQWTVKAEQMYTAVNRGVKAHMKKHPKQRYGRTEIYVTCLGKVK